MGEYPTRNSARLALRKMGRARRQNRENPRCGRKPLRLACAPSASTRAFPQKDARGHASEGRAPACVLGVIESPCPGAPGAGRSCARLVGALDQKRLALYGAGVAAPTAYASLLALANSAAVSVWAMAAVFVAALTSSIAGFAFSAICGAMLFHLLDDPVEVVEIMMVCSIAGQALMVWSLRRGIAWHGLRPFVIGAAIGLPVGVYCLLHCRPVLYVHIIGALLVLYAAFIIFRRPIIVRRQHALFDGMAGFLGGVTGGAAAFPAPSSPSGAASRALARSASAASTSRSS